MAKVLRVSIPIAETGFDPQAAGDAYSNYVNRHIFDALYAYDYLARPYKLVPNTAVALPDISPDGKTWTIRIKPGIYFADDPAFKGKKRELTAADYAFAWKRILDPKMRSNAFQTLDGKFEGADALVEAARKTGKFDYDAVLEGLQAIDRYTLRLKLNYPSYELLTDLTTPATAAVAREVVDAYGDESTWVMANPVGTGPYRLAQWRRGQKIVLEANPAYREVLFPDSGDPADRAKFAKLRGRKLPLVGRVEISVIEESNPQAPRLRESRARLPGGSDRPHLERARSRRQAQSPVRAGRRDHGARDAACDQLYLLQHGRSGRRRLHQRKNRAEARDRNGVQHRGGDPHRASGAGRAARPSRSRPTSPATIQRSAAFIKLRPRRREGASRQVRLRRSRRRRLARSAGWPAASAEPRIAAVGAGSPVRRAVEEEHGRGRRASRVRQAEVARPAEDGAPGPAADVDAGQHQHYARGFPASWGSSTVRIPVFPTSPASTFPSSTGSTTRRARCPIRRSEPSSFIRCRSSSPRMRRGSSTRTATRTVILQPWVMGYKHNVYYQHPWPYLDIDVKRKDAK